VKWENMKRKKIFIGIAACVVIFIIGLYASQHYLLKNKLFSSYDIDITKNESMGNDIMTVSKSDNVSKWDVDYQEAIENKIETLLNEKNYTLDEPLLIYNPFETNTSSVNAYFNTDTSVKIQYTVSVNDDSINDFTRTLYTGSKNETTKTHAYQIIGLVANKENTITLKALDENNKVVGEKTFTVKMGNLNSDDVPKISIEKGESTAALSNGLYTMLSHDRFLDPTIYMIDNDGIIRSEIPLKDDAAYRIVYSNDNNMIFSYSKNKLASVNRLGQIEKIYDLGKDWSIHHDYTYDEENNCLDILATKNNTGVIEDCIIKLDLTSGKVTQLIDFKDYMSDIEKKASTLEPDEKKNEEGVDWIHFNTIQLIDNKDLILSSRELSTIIRVNDIYTNPTLKYFIADDSVWDGTKYDKLNLKKVGNFVSNAGQHSVTYIEDPSLEEGQYYLIMFNNNYNGTKSRPDFDWSAYPGTGSIDKGEKSMFYKYLVDEKAGTYTLVQSIDLPYSPIVSSVQEYSGNYVVNSGYLNHVYGEYDISGTPIVQFKYSAKNMGYRVYKYSYENFWFQ
jgi:arylsulfate sulfotransferase